MNLLLLEPVRAPRGIEGSDAFVGRAERAVLLDELLVALDRRPLDLLGVYLLGLDGYSLGLKIPVGRSVLSNGWGGSGENRFRFVEVWGGSAGWDGPLALAGGMGVVSRGDAPVWYGAGLWPVLVRWALCLGRCPGLVWGGPLALARGVDVVYPGAMPHKR